MKIPTSVNIDNTIRNISNEVHNSTKARKFSHQSNKAKTKRIAKQKTGRSSNIVITMMSSNESVESFHFKTKQIIIVVFHGKANPRIKPTQKLCAWHQTNQKINQSLEGSSTNLVGRREQQRGWTPGP